MVPQPTMAVGVALHPHAESGSRGYKVTPSRTLRERPLGGKPALKAAKPLFVRRSPYWHIPCITVSLPLMPAKERRGNGQLGPHHDRREQMRNTLSTRRTWREKNRAPDRRSRAYGCRYRAGHRTLIDNGTSNSVSSFDGFAKARHQSSYSRGSPQRPGHRPANGTGHHRPANTQGIVH